MITTSLEQDIDTLYQDKMSAPKPTFSEEECAVIQSVIEGLNQGTVRAANKNQGEWTTNIWVKKAILLYFKCQITRQMPESNSPYFDKIPLKYSGYTNADFQRQQARIVPNATVRTGTYIGANCVLMPSYINIGAYLAEGTMVDTWATVGSCAQIGKKVHLSGGVGIGGILEPLRANPTIIEDHCFIGARSEIVEGVIVGEGSVISMGVYIGQSTPIYNRHTQETMYGAIPPYSVVIPGNLPDKSGNFSRYAAIIMKQVDETTRSKTAITDLLREN